MFWDVSSYRHNKNHTGHASCFGPRLAGVLDSACLNLPVAQGDSDMTFHGHTGKRRRLRTAAGELDHRAELP